MDIDKRRKQSRRIAALVGDLFLVDTYYSRENQLVLSLRYRFDRDKSLKLLKERLELAGHKYNLNHADDLLILTLDPRRRIRIPRLNIILFTLTLFSVYFVPVFYLRLLTLNNMDSWQALRATLSATLEDLAGGAGIEFTLALMSILLIHEMGHFIASRRRGIITSWPYFIPAPNIIGTFGAVIKSKSPFWNRRDLIEVGAAGPIAGWIVALTWLIYGLSESAILTGDLVVLRGIPFFLEGESILIKTLVPIFIGKADPGAAYVFNEAAFAGWVGLLVTAINMLPIGQLDGGHVLYGLTRTRQAFLGRLAMIGLVVLGFQSPMWWFFAVLGLVFGVSHPPTLDDGRPPGKPAQVMAWVALIILVVSFTPVPFR